MKICLYNVTSTMDEIGSSEVGGVEAYSFRLGEGLARRGHQVALWGGRPKEGKAPMQASFGLEYFPYVETRSIPHLGTRFRKLVQRLHFLGVSQRRFLEEDFDVVFLFKPYDLVAAWLWRSKGYSGRVILSVHGPEFYALDRTLIDQVDAVYAVSPSTAASVVEHYRRDCPVYPNFLDLRQFAMRGRKVGVGSLADELRVVTVARLVKWKGVDVLVRAFASLVRIHPQAKLTIIGDGPEKSCLKELVRGLGVEDKVRFSGILQEEDLYRELCRGDIYVQPSVGYESFSISTLEAISTGVRTVVSDQVEIGRWFQDSKSVVVYAARSVEALREALEQVAFESPARYEEWIRQARQVAEKEFDLEVGVARLETLFHPH